MGVRGNKDDMSGVKRTRRALRSSGRVPPWVGATLLQAALACFPPELVFATASLGSSAAVLLVAPFGAFLASGLASLVAPLMLRNAEPTKRVSSRGSG